MTFEEYVAFCEVDGEPPPTREEYEAAQSTPAIVENGTWRGMTLTDE